MPAPLQPHGLLIAAPSSGAGKTTIVLGLLRALARRGHNICGAKSGPDYIDPRFHEAACGATCFNLDAWAMPADRLYEVAALNGNQTIFIEGAMGLFDGAPSHEPQNDGKGACADLARHFDIPVVLIVDAARMSQSVAPLVAGFASHDPRVKIAGLILNKVGSEKHERLLRRALAPLKIPVLGSVPRTSGLTHPSRHLGLIQAGEREDLNTFVDQAADIVEQNIDLDVLYKLSRPFSHAPKQRVINPSQIQTPPAQKIAIAQDEAFAFAYPHLLAKWRTQGSEICFFSPLADNPVPDCDLIYLPGGYPELHAGRLAANRIFLQSLQNAVLSGTQIYGECGGYMILGEGLIDGNGVRHKMAGLLHLETSFAQRKLHLGYRSLSPAQSNQSQQSCKTPFGQQLHLSQWAAHEFHYASTLRADGQPLFHAYDAEQQDLGTTGLRSGSVSGSFMHLIEPLAK